MPSPLIFGSPNSSSIRGDLAPVIVALTAWGDQYAAPNGPPIIYEHATCGNEIYQETRCATCDVPVPNGDITIRLGPGMAPRTGDAVAR